MHILNTISKKPPVRFLGEGQWDGGWWVGGLEVLWGGEAGNQAMCQCHSMLCCYRKQIKRKTKPCWLLGGFSGEAGETTIAIGDEAVASDSPVGKDNPLRKAEPQDEALLSYKRKELMSDCHCVVLRSILKIRKSLKQHDAKKKKPLH